MILGPSSPRRFILPRRTVLAGTAGLLAAPAIVRAQGAGGVALVIGNSKYKWEASLPNVKRDAPDVAKRFQAMGLKTELLQDLSLSAMKQALDKFAASANGANFAAFYFAGHGTQWNKEAFLVPVDADLSEPNINALVAPELVRKATLPAAYKLRIFDNCRNNPADGWRQLESERNAVVNPEAQREQAANSPNTLLLFSTAPGRIARDAATMRIGNCNRRCQLARFFHPN